MNMQTGAAHGGCSVDSASVRRAGQQQVAEADITGAVHAHEVGDAVLAHRTFEAMRALLVQP